MKALSIILLCFIYLPSCEGQTSKPSTQQSRAKKPKPNAKPIANAGPDKSITAPTANVTLYGTSYDADGTISSSGYTWRQISGPNTATKTGQQNVLLANLIVGTYNFELKVTDPRGAYDLDSAQVKVNPAANDQPIANGGIDQTITLPIDQVTLTSASTDPDGTITSSLWTKISGPTTFTIVTPNSGTTVIRDLIQGVYDFQLKVTDNLGAESYDIVRVTVNPAISTPVESGRYTFSTIGTGERVSSGIYLDDTILIRTLLKAEFFLPGTYVRHWDGKDDFGNLVHNTGRYSVRKKFNRISYEWQGTIGNTSTAMTGDTKHHGYYRNAANIVVTSNRIWRFAGYSEGVPSVETALLSDIGTKIPVYGNINTGDLNYSCTDGTIVYAAGYDPNVSGNSYVVGWKNTDLAENPFSSGSTFNGLYQRDYPYAIDIVLSRPGSNPTGIDVQKIGTYLFVARGGVNEIHVLNKTTGALVRIIGGYTNPRALGCNPVTNTIWMATGVDSVARYTVNADGTLSAPTLTLSGIVDPQDTEVSPDGNTLVVAQGGSKQQFVFYSTSSGTQTAVLGTVGGYNGSPDVTQYKFYMTDVNGRGTGSTLRTTDIKFQSDGSFWVNDPGNFRIIHFSAGRTFIKEHMLLGVTYWTYVDKTTPTRLFSSHLEFEIDYSKPLTDPTSWKLKRNWGYGSNTTLYERAPKQQATLSNGGTYGLIRGVGTTQNNWRVIQFKYNGVRYTDKQITGLSHSLQPDGSLTNTITVSGVKKFVRYALTGFTDSIPNWSTTPEVLAILPAYDMTTGSPWAGGNAAYEPTTQKSVFFNASPWVNNSSARFPRTGYSLGLISKGIGDPLWQTEKTTHRNYRGPYPQIAYFEVGNMVNDYAGGNVNILDNSIITSYHGEFWKNGQTNRFNHYWDDGLPLGQFGTDRYTVGFSARSAPEMAGNALAPTLVKSGDDYWLYHGDESDHSAIHRWKITGMNTIREENSSMPFPNTPNPVVEPGIDLMAGLPWDDSLHKYTVPGWSMSPTTPILVDKYNNWWTVNTSVNTYKKDEPIDVYANFASKTTRTNYVRRVLPSTTSTDWKVTGYITMGGDANTNNVLQFFRVLDPTGKVLSSFYQKQRLVSGIYYVDFYGNNSLIGTGLRSDMMPYVSAPRRLEISYNAGVMTFKYGDYTMISTVKQDATADHAHPAFVELRFDAVAWGGPMAGRTAGFTGRFIENEL